MAVCLDFACMSMGVFVFLSFSVLFFVVVCLCVRWFYMFLRFMCLVWSFGT